MSTLIIDPPTAAGPERAVQRFGRYSLFAAVYTYLLIVFGGIVRITGSGLGCGDDWPKCNGRWIPEFTLTTLIEYVHRLLGVTIGLVLIGLALYAYAHRDDLGFRARSLTRPAYLVLGLVVLQGMLGAVTVWLELPTAVIVVHFMTALVIMGLLLQAAFRAGTLGQAEAPESARSGRKIARGALAALGLGFVLITFGAITANNTGAPQACQGFPLCNGRWLPASVSAVHIHWTHRLLAFVLLLHVAGVVLRSRERGAVRRAGLVALALVLTQIAVAAGLVLMHLPKHLMALHLAVGAAVWASLVIWALLSGTAVALPDDYGG